MKRGAADLADDQTSVKRVRAHSDDDDSAYISQGSTSPFTHDQPLLLKIQETAGSVTSTASSKRPKVFVCTYNDCDKAFDRPARLEIHIRSHTKERPFACEEADCGKTFLRSEHLKAHTKSKHSDQRDYVCTYEIAVSEQGEPILCGKSFHTGTRLRRHVAAHEEKEQTKCQECGQVFRKQETLQRHIRAVHLNEHAYRCSHTEQDETEECGQTFATVGQLKAHVAREHSGLRYFCDQCPHAEDGIQLGFNTYSDLQQHLKTVHPPTCGLCGHIASSNRGMKAHMEIVHQTLADRQRLECTYDGCNKKFTKQGNLNVHIQTVHANIKAYACGQVDLSGSRNMDGWSGLGCGISFGTKAGLEQHVRTQHLGHPAISAKKDRKASTAQQITGPAVTAITGHGYEESRPVACLEMGCATRFHQNHDLVIHLELHHEWNIDDINDALAELDALQGDKFWIGGFDEMGEEQSWEPSGLMSMRDAALQLEDAMEIDPVLTA